MAARKQSTPITEIEPETTTAATEPQIRDYNLRPGEFVLFVNDKGDNPKRPDVRGRCGALAGISGQATLSLFRARGLGNVATYKGPLQVRDGDDFIRVGQASFTTPRGYQPGQDLALIGKIELEDGSHYESAAYRRTSRNGLTYYGGTFRSVGDFVDPLSEAGNTDTRMDEIADRIDADER